MGLQENIFVTIVYSFYIWSIWAMLFNDDAISDSILLWCLLPVPWLFDEIKQFSDVELGVAEICDVVCKLVLFWVDEWFDGWAFKHEPVCWLEPIVTAGKLIDAVILEGLRSGLIGAPGK